MSEIIRLSPSAVATLRRCALQFHLAYNAKIRMKPSLKMVTSTAVHEAELLVNFTQKITSGDDLPLDVVQDAAVQTFERELPETTLDEEDKPDQAKDRAVRATAVYHAEVAPAVQPVLVERPLPVVLDGVEVTQFVDVVTANQEIRDLKVVGRSTPAHTAGGSLQLNSYALGYLQLTDSLPASIQLDEIVTSKELKHNPVRAKPRPESAAAVYRAAASFVTRIREDPSGSIFPADPSSPAAPCSWCGYRPICSQANPGARIPWMKFVAGPEGIELARKEAKRVMEQNLDARPSNRKWDEETV